MVKIGTRFEIFPVATKLPEAVEPLPRLFPWPAFVAKTICFKALLPLLAKLLKGSPEILERQFAIFSIRHMSCE